MKTGQASRTAELVCMGRAVAHALPPVARFSDATALRLLSPALQQRVERAISSAPARGLRAKFDRSYLRKQSQMMTVRTVAIDDVVRAARAPQVVILGAGLDGRAWRMPELADAVVFEVDHPDSQREKRERTGPLAPAAREVRFVAVDFARDSLEEALERAGHVASLLTTWIWEGVVMYLTPAATEATLSVIRRRSAPASHLLVVYHAPHWMLKVVGLIVARLGEPLRSSTTPAQMRDLLAKYGFSVQRDANLAELGRELSPALGHATKVAAHIRLASAERSA